MSFLKAILQGIADSSVNLAQQNAEPRGGAIKKGSLTSKCTPCAAAAKRQAIQKKWGSRRS